MIESIIIQENPITKNKIHFLIMNTDLWYSDIIKMTVNQINELLKEKGYFDD